MSPATSKFLASRTLNILQAPIALGQGLEGVDEGPGILLQSGLIAQAEQLGWKVSKNLVVKSEKLVWDSPIGNLPAHQHGVNIKFPNELGEACRQLAEHARASNEEKSFTLTLGGDHSVAIGSIGGALLSRPDLRVVWIDAHADFNTPETSPSGNIHGMPLSFLTGLMQRYNLPSFAWLKNFLSNKQLALVGLRSIDPEEKDLLKSWGAHVYTMTEIDRHGIGGVMEQVKSAMFADGEHPLHLSYDIDAVDPHFAPSTGTRVRGGLSYREAHYIAECVAETGALVGMDLVEINPRLGYVDPAHRPDPGENSNITVEIGIELVASALGKRIY